MLINLMWVFSLKFDIIRSCKGFDQYLAVIFITFKKQIVKKHTNTKIKVKPLHFDLQDLHCFCELSRQLDNKK